MTARIRAIFPGVVFFATCWWAWNLPCYAESNPAYQIDALLRQWHADGEFNGVVLVADHGQIAYHGAFGVSSANGQTPLAPRSVFRLASVSKSFTGMSVVMLEAAGKLSYDDDITEYIPELPYTGITIRHLLHHTSGLPDYVALLEEHWDDQRKGRPDRQIARSPDALKMLVEHRPAVHFSPGEQWEYSNTGYIMLGLLVERVSGKPFEQFLRDRIFQPLGMNDTVLFNPLAPAKIANRAFGFSVTELGRIPNDENFLNGMYGDGEVYSTATDLLKWDQALYGAQLATQAQLAVAFAPGKLNDGQATAYGFGWEVKSAYGHQTLSHAGGWVGFRTWLERDLNSRRTLVILTNDTSKTFGKVKRELQKIAFESPDLIPTRERQVPWMSANVQGSPEPLPPYRAEIAFPNLKLRAPVTITNAPNTDRLFVVQVRGEVVSFPEDPSCETPDLLLNLQDVNPRVSNVYGLTFHPDYPQQPFIYVCYILAGTDENGSVISRFTVDQFQPPRADPKSERILLRWLAGGHNGCCLKFGPDGYLYASMGDGTGPTPPDILRAGQDLTNYLSTIVRIDVNASTEEQPYTVPADNPFINLPGAKPEIWAYGFRNPWKMSFDRKTGDLWVGDVGWDMWELVYRVVRGGNYGWSIMEGSNPIHPTEERGPTPILPPDVQHHHSEARSVTGGYVYHGARHKDLVGAYVYGDYNTGKMWATRFNDGQPPDVREIAQTPLQIVGFGETNAGELYFADHRRTNHIYHLVPNDEQKSKAKFPSRLSETGLFSSLPNLTPAPGVEAYEVNAELWQDGAAAARHLAIPGKQQIRFDETGRLRFPQDTVALRTLSLPDADGNVQRLETQMLHYDGRQWNPYSYVWNPAQDDAQLAPVKGMTLQVDVGAQHPLADAQGNLAWQVQSRVNCRVCHAKGLGGVLGLTLRQLNSSVSRNATLLDDWITRGVLEQPPSPAAFRQQTFVDPRDLGADLDARARTYLHVNCISCHRVEGGGPSPMRVAFELPLKETRLRDRPVQGDLGLPNARIVLPGDPARSVLFYRLAKVGSGHMPHIGAKSVDVAGLQMIHDWIEQLPRGSKPESTAGAIDAALATPLGTLELAWSLHNLDFDGEARAKIIERAIRAKQPHVRDLLEPFFPASMRKKRLGTSFDTNDILALTGNSDRGRGVFQRKALQCVSCHQVANEGGLLGPALDDIGKKYAASAELLRTIVDPSEKIDAAYQTQLVLTTLGESLTGRLLEQTDAHVTLLTVDQKQRQIARDDIDDISVSKQSLMPEALLQALSPQEAADLLSYLQSLRRDEDASER